MQDLIARLEAATGPSRELDAVVFCAAVHPEHKPARNFFYKNRDEWGIFISNHPRPGLTFHDAPRYTASIDAALTLMPDGCEWNLAWNSGFAFVEVGDPLLHMEAEHKVIAIALVIAALKARIGEKK